MYGGEEVVTRREVGAIQIPDGTRTVIPEGERLVITQELGSSFTVMTSRGALLRIDERNADAIGKEPRPRPGEEEPAEPAGLEERVWAQMKRCYDPEIPVNIVDLGLIYDCRVVDLDGDDHRVEVKMTLTAPGCGMGPVLAEDVRAKIEELPGVREAKVEVVFDPPWNMNMMTEAARLQLGLL